ncbi:hypothetical protein M0765_026585 [Variovorax sp. S2]|jgi:hypothetical protein|uniref:hypothetical protein n=1 Tax=Variovorax sp. S12S4 TaxID=3029170 RepID=UPI00215B8A4D|nr:hypothetical protein [Variovorax sp. S12S4]MCR8961167.1 hypothetical protein [Variovorax sp. S12S4]
MTTYEQHPLSAAFPAMSDAEFTALVDSIADIGVQNPVTLFEGMVLDGWNRYRATLEAGVECPSVEFEGDDPVRFVRAQNKHRRHLTAGAWALVEVALCAWKPAHRPDKGAAAAPLRSNAEMAASAGVAVRTIQQAKVVATSGTPDVQQAVKAGAVSVEKAADIARLPKEEQAAALSAPKPAKFKGKAKKGPKAELIRAELKAAANRSQAEKSEARVAELEQYAVELGQQLADAREAQAELEADHASLCKVVDANDQLAAALAEAKKYRDLAAGLQQRINSMMTEIAELKRSVKHWQKKAGQPA